MTFFKKLFDSLDSNGLKPPRLPEGGKGVNVKIVFADPEEEPLEIHAAHCAPNDGFFQVIETTYPHFRAVYIPALQIKAIYVVRKVDDKGERREGNPHD